jgi:hypothetical protein
MLANDLTYTTSDNLIFIPKDFTYKNINSFEEESICFFKAMSSYIGFKDIDSLILVDNYGRILTDNQGKILIK